MGKVQIVDWTKKDSLEAIDLADEVFGVAVRKDILHQVVRWQLACRRQGTSSTKTRAFVRGGGKKPFRQKGTGNARQGTIRSPLMPGGAVVFGPQPRDYSYTLPKKIRSAGLRSALSFLYQQGRIFVVNDMVSELGRTAELSKRLNAFGIKKALLVDVNVDFLFKRASKNLPHFCYQPVKGLNVYDLLKYNNLIITKEAIDAAVSRCKVGE